MTEQSGTSINRRDALGPYTPEVINRLLGSGQAGDTLGQAVDALNSAIAQVNAASQRVKAFGVSPQISVNGTDYGDTVSLYLQGEPTETENL